MSRRSGAIAEGMALNLARLVENLLAPLTVVGDYAIGVQARIACHLKAGEAEYCNSVVTDADLAIQNYLEVHLLSLGGDWSLFAEEASLNAQYFPADRPWEVSIDPINGTLLYKDGLDNFDIIVALSDAEAVQAAIVYMPKRETFFFAIRGRGAFSCTRRQYLGGRIWNRFRCQSGAATVLIHGDAASAEALGGDFATVDYVRDYRPGEPMPLQNAILTGELAAFIRIGAMVIDWGAVALIAAEAGGVATDIDGHPVTDYRRYPEHRAPSLIVSTDAATHGRVLACLRVHGGAARSILEGSI